MSNGLEFGVVNETVPTMLTTFRTNSFAAKADYCQGAPLMKINVNRKTLQRS